MIYSQGRFTYDYKPVLDNIFKILTVISKWPSSSTLYRPPVSCSNPFRQNILGLGDPNTLHVRTMTEPSVALYSSEGGSKITGGSSVIVCKRCSLEVQYGEIQHSCRIHIYIYIYIYIAAEIKQSTK